MRMDAVDLVRREGAVLSDLRAAGPDHRVRACQQCADEFDAVIDVRFGHDAVLRTREKTEQRAVTVGRDLGARCRPPAQRITARRFDFDHRGAAVGEQLRAVGAGDSRGQVDDEIAVPVGQSAGSTDYSVFLRFDLLNRKSGGNLLSLSLTAPAKPAVDRLDACPCHLRRAGGAAAHRLEEGGQQAAHVLALVLLEDLEEDLLLENGVGRTIARACPRVLVHLCLELVPRRPPC